MKLWVANFVIEQMIALGREFGPLETGGILLGWRDKEDRVVTGLVGPGPRAMHGRHAFVPDHRWQVEELHRIFRLSNRDLDYLGDWHTHPSGPALMSEEDNQTLRRIGRKVTVPVMVIVDPSKSPAHFAAWTLRRVGWFRHSIEEVEVRPFNPDPNWPSYLSQTPTRD